uniref:Uncharacterized protein n=1 Tax=Anopheles merus TaxID=30066 RepID=A0A182V0M0_ANOME
MNSVHSVLFHYFPHTHISNVLNVLPRKQHKQSEQKGRPWARGQELGESGLRAFSIDDNPPYSVAAAAATVVWCRNGGVAPAIPSSMTRSSRDGRCVCASSVRPESGGAL